VGFVIMGGRNWSEMDSLTPPHPLLPQMFIFLKFKSKTTKGSVAT
jgi:hypothetical protein